MTKILSILILAISLQLAALARGFVPSVNQLWQRKTIVDAAKEKEEDKEVRIPLGKKERYVRKEKMTLEQLEQDYQELKDHLRHDLFQLKHQQHEVAQEEDALLHETLDQIQYDRFAQELSIMAAEEDYQFAHKQADQARQDKQRAVRKWAQDQSNFLQHPDWQSYFALGCSTETLKKTNKACNDSQQAEQRAQQKESTAMALLQFLEEQEAQLKEIGQDPQKEQTWAQDELAHHHQSLLQVVSLERETENLWNQLKQDLHNLKHLQAQVIREEWLVAAKEEEILDQQVEHQKANIQAVLAEMKQTHQQVKQVVAEKEEAYKETLRATELGEMKPTDLWMLSEAAQHLNQSNEASNAVKEKLTRLVEKEAKAEELLMVLERKAAMLKELRLPGQEEALQKWVREELADHQDLLQDVKENKPIIEDP